MQGNVDMVSSSTILWKKEITLLNTKLFLLILGSLIQASHEYLT